MVSSCVLTQFFTLNQTVVRLFVEVLFELTKRQTKEADKSEVRRYLNVLAFPATSTKSELCTTFPNLVKVTEFWFIKLKISLLFPKINYFCIVLMWYENEAK